MLITLANDDDTFVLSDSVTDEVVYCSISVTLIPATVFSTNVGIAELPLSIIFATLSKLSSTALLPNTINFAKSLAKFRALIVSVSCESVACDGNK